MRKTMYNWALVILHKKRQTLTFSRRHRKEVFNSHSKENHFLVQKRLSFFIIILFRQKLKILVLSYSTLTLLHSEWPKLYTILAILSAIWLKQLLQLELYCKEMEGEWA